MIRLDNVTKSYMTLRGRHLVFRDLSIDFPEGVNVGLIGAQRQKMKRGEGKGVQIFRRGPRLVSQERGIFF